MDYRISDVKSSDIKPVLVTFQNGLLNKNYNIKSTFLRNSNNRNTVAVENNKMLYVGEVKEHESFNNYLIIVNKDKNKAKLVEVNTATLQPYVPKEDLDTTQINKTIAELHKEFGSKKAKRRTEHIERMRMDVENVREQLEDTVSGVKVRPSDITMPTTDENDNEYRPPIDRKASKKEEVYVLESLIPKEVLESLHPKALSILESDIDVMDLKPYVKSQLKALQQSSEKDKSKLKKCKIFLYIDCLLTMLLTSAKQIANKSFTICDYSSEVNSHILNNFSITLGNKRSRPMTMRDKCICYLLVLLIIVQDYSLDMEELSVQIKIGMKKIQEYGRALALSTMGTSLVLKLPLPAPLSLKRKSM